PPDSPPLPDALPICRGLPGPVLPDEHAGDPVDAGDGDHHGGVVLTLVGPLEAHDRVTPVAKEVPDAGPVLPAGDLDGLPGGAPSDRKSTRLNSSHVS